MSKKRHLKNSANYKDVYIQPENTSKGMLDLKTAQQLVANARRCYPDAVVKLRGTTVIIDDQTFRPSEYDKLPKGVSREEASTIVTPKGTGFQGHESWLSNFHPTPVSDPKGHVFELNEQYHASLTCDFLKRPDIKAQVEQINNPYYLKALMSQVKRNAAWYETGARETLETVVRAKFSQHADLRNKLKELKGPIFECTKSKVYGNGHYLNDAENIAVEINGYENMMGKLLSTIRDEYNRQ